MKPDSGEKALRRGERLRYAPPAGAVRAPDGEELHVAGAAVGELQLARAARGDQLRRGARVTLEEVH
jgi:hypothetical protein